MLFSLLAIQLWGLLGKAIGASFPRTILKKIIKHI